MSNAAASVKKFAADLARLPRVVAQKVATATAPALTALALQTFNSGENPYGVTWDPGADGQHITLRKSGGLSRGLYYVATGTKMRVALGVHYAKFQVWRGVFPGAQGDLPKPYQVAIGRSTESVCRAELGGS